jgi:hypothetical protein
MSEANRSVKMKSRFTGTCGVCKKDIPAGLVILWNPQTKKVAHIPCLEKKRVKKFKPKMPKVIECPEAYYRDKPFSGSYKNGRSPR